MSRNTDEAKDGTEDEAMARNTDKASDKAAQMNDDSTDQKTKGRDKDNDADTSGETATDASETPEEVAYSVVFDDEDDALLDLDDADDDTAGEDDDAVAEADAGANDETEAAEDGETKEALTSKDPSRSGKADGESAASDSSPKGKTKASTHDSGKTDSSSKPKAKTRKPAKSPAAEPASALASKIDRAEAIEDNILLKPNPTFAFDHVTLRNRKTGRNALDDIDWQFFAGKLYLLRDADDEQRRAFLGAASGFLRLDIGQVTVRSVSLIELDTAEIRGHRIALLTQRHNLRGDLDALANLTFTMKSTGRTFLEPVPVRARKLLKRVGFDQAATGLPVSELTELNQRRVAIARAISCDPTVILADDPAGGLEPEDRDAILGLLTKLAHSRDPKYCVILVAPTLDAADGTSDADAGEDDKSGDTTDSRQDSLIGAYLAAADKTYEF
ncbi:ATP-binding cassette domain-containing protein [Bifidobacterium sp. ESL0763]|uniref:ATP-binding cassette domain-containing protein n=1 Tax=Bifidobacterium sp. ESL0763 TaxID=2983227 RepID=UPI0023F6B441|nr:ATP-binding cassette domain-containing protein [Bifidobacterium sp. ESL0763]MDF7664428.1 ATP-binding cassette domain-containing protein [Bifidobacterium sp. ESL0763]